MQETRNRVVVRLYTPNIPHLHWSQFAESRPPQDMEFFSTLDENLFPKTKIFVCCKTYSIVDSITVEAPLLVGSR